jgi:ribosome-associated protein
VELSWDLAGSPVLSPALRERALERLAGRLVGGVLTIVASEHRSQLRNREAAEARLAGVVAGAVAPPPRVRRATKPSRGATERRIADKKRRGQIKRGRRGDTD